MQLGRTVEELLETISAEELEEKIELYRLDPWGEWRADWRAGQIAATIANVNRRKGSKAFEPSDFMPEFGRRETEQPKSMAAQMAAEMNRKR